MWMSKNAHFYFQPSGHHGVPINGTQVMLKELKEWFAIFHLCFYYWLAIAVTCIAIRDAILNKMFPVLSRYLNEPQISCERVEEIVVFGHFQLGSISLVYKPTKLI